MRIYIYTTAMRGTGGMETVVKLVANGLIERGHNCKLLMSHAPEDGSVGWLNVIPNHIICDNSVGGIPTAIEDAIAKHVVNLQVVLKDLPIPDIILTLNHISTKVAKVATERLNPRPIVISQPHFNLDYINNSSLFSYADGHLAISSGIEKQLKQLDPKKPISLIYNPIEESNGYVIKKPKVPTFCYVGRIWNHQKRLDFMFKSLAKIKDKEWSLKIVGDDETQIYKKDADDLKLLSKHLGIDERIEWMGFRDDPWEAIGEASALLLTSEFEGFALVIAEALARGLPVISSKCPVGPEDIIIHNYNGWLYPVGEEHGFVNLLEHFLDNQLNIPSVDECIASVQKFSKTNILNNLEYALEHYVNKLSRKITTN